jgi:hypothetical protein
MRFAGFQFDPTDKRHGKLPFAVTGSLAILLAATLFLPPWLLPRAAVLLPLTPVQNPQEEESHSSHSVAAQLQQLSGFSSGRVRSRATRIAHSHVQRGMCVLAAHSSWHDSLRKSELLRRNGCGAPLRC